MKRATQYGLLLLVIRLIPLCVQVYAQAPVGKPSPLLPLIYRSATMTTGAT